MICPDEREEISLEPRSFCNVEDRGVSKQFILGMAEIIESNEDDGKDRPGDVHVPTESSSIKFVERFPEIFDAMFAKLEEKLGPWNHN